MSDHTRLERDKLSGKMWSTRSRASSESSSSAMELSSLSDSATSEPHPVAGTVAGGKRKLSSSPTATQPESGPNGKDTLLKKRRLEEHRPAIDLPAHLWQKIFQYLPPAALGRCLSVCKDFNKYLTSTRPKRLPQDLIPAEPLWAHARKFFLNGVPRPMEGFTELAMLQLAAGITCQFCRKQPQPRPAAGPYNAGPGVDGVRVIWSLRMRVCGPCLEAQTQTDIDILLSSESQLRSGLPFGFLSQDKHFVSESRRLSSGIPSTVQASRVYAKRDIANIVQEHKEISSFGEGVTDEWVKGLSVRSKRLMADAARWENWESQARRGSELWQIFRQYDASSFPRISQQIQSTHAVAADAQPTAPARGIASLPPKPQASVHSPDLRFGASSFTARPTKTPHEIAEIRSHRKAEIEFRCLQLEPPLRPNVLQHIEAFQASVMIGRPLTEIEWKALKLRILAQRESAEYIEHQKAEQLAALNAAIPQAAMPATKTAKGTTKHEKAFEQAQETLRKTLAGYAETFIKSHGNNAELRSKDNCHRAEFAAKALLYIRHRCLEDYKAGLLSLDAQSLALKLDGEAPKTSPFLSLENMRWVFEHSIRKFLTEPWCRDLFYCSECVNDGNLKPYGFDSLVQHYAAKHTSDFSRDNVVVHWSTAEWPDPAPFHPDPMDLLKPWHTGVSVANGEFNGRRFATHAEYRAKSTDGENIKISHTILSPVYQPDPAHDVAAALAPNDASDKSQRFYSDTIYFWNELGGVEDMLDCVRLHTALEHAAWSFEHTYREQPSLALVISSFSAKDADSQIKNAPGLACKVCVASSLRENQIGETYYIRMRNTKLYRTVSLMNHFKSHLTQKNSQPVDWRQDMIEVPEAALVGQLLRASGMNDKKLRLVAAVFPEAFPATLPKIGTIQEHANKHTAARVLDRIENRKKKKHASKKRKAAAGADQAQFPPARSRGEKYDPLRPQLEQDKSSESDDDDDARFDTDVARKTENISGHVDEAATLNLSPEVLIALENLRKGALDTGLNRVQSRSTNDPATAQGTLADTATQQQQQRQENRSPSSFSVGSVSEQTAKPVSVPVPDIGALLASLAPGASLAEARNDTTRDAQRRHSPDPPHQRSTQSRLETHYHSQLSLNKRHSPRAFVPDPHQDLPYGEQKDSVGNELESVLMRTALNYEQLHRPVSEQPRHPHRYADREQNVVAQSMEQHYTTPTPYQHHDRMRTVPPIEYRQVYYSEPIPHARQQSPGYDHRTYAHPHQEHGEPVYVDQYGRRVEVIRVAEATPPFAHPPQPHRYVDQPIGVQSYGQTPLTSSGQLWYDYPPPRPTYISSAEYQQSPYRQPVYYQQVPQGEPIAAPRQEQVTYVNEAGRIYRPNQQMDSGSGHTYDGRSTRY